LTSSRRNADPILAELRHSLVPLGFTRRGRTFNRAIPGGLVHVLDLQLGATIAYGKFTANVAVFLPEVALALAGIDHPPAFVREPDCEIRARLGKLLPQPIDRWWSLDPPSIKLVAAELRDAVLDHGIPFLNGLSDRQEIIERWQAGLLDRFTPPRRNVSLAAILHRVGNTASANLILHQESVGPNQNIGRLARIAASRLGLTVPPRQKDA